MLLYLRLWRVLFPFIGFLELINKYKYKYKYKVKIPYKCQLKCIVVITIFIYSLKLYNIAGRVHCISKECGFCYWDLPSGVTNGSCWSENPHNPSSSPSSGICNNATATGGLVWAVNWCPSRYSWIAVVALGIYLLFFAPGNKTNILWI